MGTSRSVACDPTLSVDRDVDARNVCDKKTRLERLELIEQGLSKLRAQPWLTVAVLKTPTQHTNLSCHIPAPLVFVTAKKIVSQDFGIYILALSSEVSAFSFAHRHS